MSPSSKVCLRLLRVCVVNVFAAHWGCAAVCCPNRTAFPVSCASLCVFYAPESGVSEPRWSHCGTFVQPVRVAQSFCSLPAHTCFLLTVWGVGIMDLLVGARGLLHHPDLPLPQARGLPHQHKQVSVGSCLTADNPILFLSLCTG